MEWRLESGSKSKSKPGFQQPKLRKPARHQLFKPWWADGGTTIQTRWWRQKNAITLFVESFQDRSV